jgi:hypothetical protein
MRKLSNRYYLKLKLGDMNMSDALKREKQYSAERTERKTDKQSIAKSHSYEQKR